MQAVILAAGKSTRTYPLTLTRPKSLLRIANETILEHNLKQLEGLADEIVIIVGYKKGMIEDFVKEKGIDKRFKIIFVEQKEQMGTGHALLQAKDCLNDRFILMYGDDLYSRKDIENCLKHKYCLLGQRVKDSGRFGVLVTEGNKVKEIIPKSDRTAPRMPPSPLPRSPPDIGVARALRASTPVFRRASTRRSPLREYSVGCAST